MPLPVEPVSLALFKQHAKISGSEEDDLLLLYISTAREMAEKRCNIPLVTQVWTETFTIDQKPTVAVENILSVSGHYNSLVELLNAPTWVEYIKGSIYERSLPIDFYHLPEYTITYLVTVDPDTVPATLKSVICKMANELYANRENSTELAHQELSTNFKLMLAPYRKFHKY